MLMQEFFLSLPISQKKMESIIYQLKAMKKLVPSPKSEYKNFSMKSTK